MTARPPATPPAIVWFRDDLRLADNPALQAAHATGAPLILVYVLETAATMRPLGGASRWWLHHALAALAADVEARGGRLDILHGESATLVPALAEAAGAAALFWTRRYAADEIKNDTAVKAALKELGCVATSFNGQLLHEPWEVKTAAGDPFRVYTPFWRAARALPAPPAPTGAPCTLAAAPYPQGGPTRVALADLALLPTKPDWAGGLRATWTPGEAGARQRLHAFLDGAVARYAADRDSPAADATSLLSPHLRFGEMSPRQIWHATLHMADGQPKAQKGADKFLAELGWREFDYHVLFHNPDLATANFQTRFDAMPWRKLPQAELEAWQRGRTGYPLVDAGMRELWQTGYMQNRVRMVAASFLVKHLLGDWRIGERWFWDTLCDADGANNPANWQWVAGSGADAAPYFRVFNPILQGLKFDAAGAYVRRFVPELANLPDAWIHKPWEAPPDVLAEAGVRLGTTYPHPIVAHEEGRKRALAAFAALKG